MSRSKTSRGEILDVTLRALEKGELSDLNMGSVARLAGISRQALYLHFDGRTELALELGRHAEEASGLVEGLEELRAATDGADLLDRLATLLGRFYPRIYPAIRMAEALRATVPELDAARKERRAERRMQMRAIVKQLRDWGALSSEWTIPAAADWLCAITSEHQWAELVLEQGWSARRFTEVTGRILKKGLLG